MAALEMRSKDDGSFFFGSIERPEWSYNWHSQVIVLLNSISLRPHSIICFCVSTKSFGYLELLSSVSTRLHLRI